MRAAATAPTGINGSHRRTRLRIAYGPAISVGAIRSMAPIPLRIRAAGFSGISRIARGKTVRIYGEYAGRMAEPAGKQRAEFLARWRKDEDFTKEWNITAPIASLNKILARNYPSLHKCDSGCGARQYFLHGSQEVGGRAARCRI